MSPWNQADFLVSEDGQTGNKHLDKSDQLCEKFNTLHKNLLPSPPPSPPLDETPKPTSNTVTESSGQVATEYKTENLDGQQTVHSAYGQLLHYENAQKQKIEQAEPTENNTKHLTEDVKDTNVDNDSKDDKQKSSDYKSEDLNGGMKKLRNAREYIMQKAIMLENITHKLMELKKDFQVTYDNLFAMTVENQLARIIGFNTQEEFRVSPQVAIELHIQMLLEARVKLLELWQQNQSNVMQIFYKSLANLEVYEDILKTIEISNLRKPKAKKIKRETVLNFDIFDGGNESMVTLGPFGTKIKRSFLESLNWDDQLSHLLRRVVVELFSRETLAQSNLTGKESPAFKGMNLPLKRPLDKSIVDDIVYWFEKVFGMNEKRIKQIISIKCADESKFFRKKEQNANSSFVSAQNQRNDSANHSFTVQLANSK